MTTKEHAATIRAALKKQGISSQQVSVVSDCYSLGSAIRVTIKDPHINIVNVRQLAEPHELVHRCEVTGEILCGGNRYVTVEYTRDAIQARSQRYLPALTDAAAKRDQAHDNSLIPIEGTRYLLGKSPYGRFSLWSDSFLCEAYTLDGLAREIGARVSL